jgi:tRNA A-37 threonylcarbamoyl transferase component Bud32
VYGIHQPSLKEFKTHTKNACFDVEPATKYRLIGEEILPMNGGDTPTKDTEEFEIEQKPEDFRFENRASIKKQPVRVAQIDLIDNL